MTRQRVASIEVGRFDKNRNFDEFVLRKGFLNFEVGRGWWHPSSLWPIFHFFIDQSIKNVIVHKKLCIGAVVTKVWGCSLVSAVKIFGLFCEFQGSISNFASGGKNGLTGTV